MSEIVYGKWLGKLDNGTDEQLFAGGHQYSIASDNGIHYAKRLSGGWCRGENAQHG